MSTISETATTWYSSARYCILSLRTRSLSLLAKSRNALGPKGRIAIHEFYLENNRASPVPGALFSVNMLVNTAAGRSYTPEEMRAWLKATGFKGIRTKVLGDTVVLTGQR